MAVFTLETDHDPSSKSVKIDGKRMDKVRRIVHPKLRPFHFQIGHLHLEVMWHRFYENESYMILPSKSD